MTNYRTWSFRFLIYLVILNLLIGYMIANTSTLFIESEGLEKPKDYNSTIMVILMGLTNILLISGIVLTILSVIKKEKKDYKYVISIIGYSIFILLAVISLI